MDIIGYPTGPGMIVDLMTEKQYRSFVQNTELFNSLCGHKIYSKQKPILKHYSEYRKEQSLSEIKKQLPHYHDCWDNKNIYKTKLTSQIDSNNSTNPQLTSSASTTIPV